MVPRHACRLTGKFCLRKRLLQEENDSGDSLRAVPLDHVACKEDEVG